MARQLVQDTGGTLLEVCVGSRPVWKDPGHPFRHDPELHLSGIPTVIQWTAAGPAERIGTSLVFLLYHMSALSKDHYAFVKPSLCRSCSSLAMSFARVFT